MALSDDRIAEMMRDTWGCASIAPRHALEFARAIEAEVRKDDTELIRQMLDALECNGEPDDPGHRCGHCDEYVDRNSVLRKAARARLEGKP